MHWDRPIAYTAAAADGFAWANHFSGRHCQCATMGLSYVQLKLPNYCPACAIACTIKHIGSWDRVECFQSYSSGGIN